jgi:tetratricopeptide (TPR) repeat protein
MLRLNDHYVRRNPGVKLGIPGGVLTACSAGSDNRTMRRTCTLLFFLSVVASLPLCRLCAQDEEPQEEPRPYVPPPAWKSVEVGDYYLKQKSYRAALSRYQEAAKIDSYYAPSYLGMGKVYERLGLRQKALENYRKYLDLLPSSKEAAEAREVHEAIARLERRLKSSKFPARAQSPSEFSASSD